MEFNRNMKIFAGAALVLALLLGTLVLLKPKPAKTVAPGKTRWITDMYGNKIQVPDPLERVALFGGPTGQIAYLLGARNQLCAVTSSIKGSRLINSFDPSIQELPGPRSTSGHINIEALLVSKPQLVVAGTLDGSIVEKKTGIPVAYTESSMSHGLDLLKREIRFYASVFNKEERGEKYLSYLDRTISFIKSRTADIPADKRLKVFNGYGPGHLVTLGGDTFMHERIVTAGCVDAAASVNTSGVKEGLHSGLSEMSMEKVLGWDPDILVIDSGRPEELYSDPRWNNIKAVRNRRVYKQPVGIFIWDRPTAEAAVLYPLWLAKTAYPERFRDVDLISEVKKFYGEIISFQLSDQQARDILAGNYTLKFGSEKGKR